MPEDLPSLSPIPRVADSAAARLPLNRLVALTTPIAALSTAVFGGWLLDNFSDRVDSATRRGVMLASSASVTAMAYKWLDGWRRYEEQEFTVEHGLINGESDPSALATLATDDGYPALEPEPDSEGSTP